MFEVRFVAHVDVRECKAEDRAPYSPFHFKKKGAEGEHESYDEHYFRKSVWLLARP